MNRTTKVLTAAIIALILVASTEGALLASTNINQNQTLPVRVACIGDSITRGTEYTLDLWALIGADYVIGDFGVSGATVSLHSEAAYMNKTAFTTAKEFEPDIVLVMLGTNDADSTLNETTQEFVSDYISLLDAFKASQKEPLIYIIQPPPIFPNNCTLSQALLIERVTPGIMKVSAQTGIQVIDALSPLEGKPELFVDGVHPTAEGAKKIAEAVYAAVSWQ